MPEGPSDADMERETYEPRPGRPQEIAEALRRYSDLTPVERIDAVFEDLHSWAGDETRVLLIGDEQQYERLVARMPPRNTLKVVRKISLPPGQAPFGLRRPGVGPGRERPGRAGGGPAGRPPMRRPRVAERGMPAPPSSSTREGPLLLMEWIDEEVASRPSS